MADLRAARPDVCPCGLAISAFPFCWLAFTLIRGAIIGWYPYPFIDVTSLGYGKTILNCVWLSLLLLGLAAGATFLDARISAHSPKPTAEMRENAGD